MSPSRLEPPSAAEWKILKAVFERGPCAGRDVVEAMAVHGWSPSTVKTLLRRLVDKGHLKTRRVGSSFLYRPSRSIHKSLRDSADQLLDQAVDGAMGPLLQYLVRKSSLSAADLDELQSLIDARRAAEERPEEDDK